MGIIFCVMSGCVNYSRRFYDETLRDPATASPLVFPETVFNAPSSHLAAVLGATAINYTLVGDPGTFLQGLALGAQWLVQGFLDGCVIIGAEEMDWLTADAFRLFNRTATLSEGAGAVYLRREVTARPMIELRGVTDSQLYSPNRSRSEAASLARGELPVGNTTELLCDSTQGVPRLDAAEAAAWAGWQGARISPKKILGEGLMAAAAWQCVLAVAALKEGRHGAANVSVVGCNQQAIGARFEVLH
jgi:3-oxoacyl-(acyl-carrier-protein) synthase